MLPPQKFNLEFIALTTSTTLWLIDLASELKISVEYICWQNKYNEKAKFIGVIITNTQDNFYGEITLSSYDIHKLYFINYLFYKRIYEIRSLNNIYKNIKGEKNVKRSN